MSQETILQLSVVAYLLPLLGFVILVFFNKRLPRQGDLIETAIVFLGLILSGVIFAFKMGSYQNETIQATFTWVSFGTVPGVGPMVMTLGI
ncbi:MAG: SoxR reducing system RseC family protein, partial [Ignavibacteriales bacterium]|nr:SoxR reducing system RseC family protein [Ignavibacteriales bacterium]